MGKRYRDIPLTFSILELRVILLKMRDVDNGQLAAHEVSAIGRIKDKVGKIVGAIDQRESRGW